MMSYVDLESKFMKKLIILSLSLTSCGQPTPKVPKEYKMDSKVIETGRFTDYYRRPSSYLIINRDGEVTQFVFGGYSKSIKYTVGDTVSYEKLREDAIDKYK